MLRRSLWWFVARSRTEPISHKSGSQWHESQSCGMRGGQEWSRCGGQQKLKK